MSTRAVYSFKDSNNTFHVYKHHDGYPSGAVQWILAALPYAWQLPRFEASEFATAFIAANKELREQYQGGDVYLTHGHDQHGDLDYRYEISFNGSYLIIHAYSIYFSQDKQHEKIIFEGTLEEFANFKER